jgi:hypothetical protein
MCYLGHGAFGVMTKSQWAEYFAVVGIGELWAYRLMPLVGAADIAVALIVLLSPRPIVLAHAVVWSVWTALLRPLSGDSGWEAIERAGNYGAPLALLLLCAWPTGLAQWFAPLRDSSEGPSGTRGVGLALRITTAMLLAGHGALGVLEKPLLAEHYASIGLPVAATALVGWIELSLAGVVLLRPTIALLWSVVLWKVATELLFPVSGASAWEFVERGGSYAAPLALVVLQRGVAR